MAEANTARDTGQPPANEPTAGRDPVPAVVDWLLAIVAGGIGLVATAVGVGLYTQVDRTLIAEVIRADTTEVNGLTPSEAITAAGPFIDWLSAGLVVTGLALVGAAVAFVIARRRTRQQVAREGGTTATFWACAVYGAAVTALLSFIPGAGVAGGGVAAYLRDGSGVRAGAAAGLVGTALTIPLIVALAGGFTAGAGAIELVGGGVLLAGVVLGGGLFGIALNLAFGALGGFLVARFL